MKIMLIHAFLQCGGTEHQTLFLANFFQREGHAVSLLVFRPGGHLAGNLRNSGVRHTILQPFDFRFDWLAPGLLGEIGKQSPDVVLCMGRVANCYAGFIQKTFQHIYVVGTVRTGKNLPLLYRWSLKVVKGVLANSCWWRDRLTAYGLDASKIKTVHNALIFASELKEKTSSRVRIRRQMEAEDSTCVFLNVANFHPGKRHADLIRIFAKLDTAWDWQLWLVGEGEERVKCHRLATQLGLKKRIRFTGHCDNPCHYYAGADVAVSASLQDSLPNFLIEAQALGLPVVACACRGVGETFLPGESGFLIPPQNPKDFLHAVERLQREKELRKSQSERAITFARERFSSDRQSHKILRFLKEGTSRMQ